MKARDSADSAGLEDLGGPHSEVQELACLLALVARPVTLTYLPGLNQCESPLDWAPQSAVCLPHLPALGYSSFPPASPIPHLRRKSQTQDLSSDSCLN